MLVGTDVGIQQPEFAVLDQAIRILEVGQPAPDRFHLGPGQDHPRLKFFQQEVVM